MSKPDGGPAYPVFEVGWDDDGRACGTVAKGGMSLRDYFAAQALAGIYASAFTDYRCPPCDKCAEWSYAVADAMIFERSKP